MKLNITSGVNDNFNSIKQCLITIIILIHICCIFCNAQTVQIGDQIWATQNLDVSTFRNGELIPHAKTNEEWENAGLKGEPAWCYYDNDSLLGLKFGKLYNWFAVMDPRGIAPSGWHIPSDDEWSALSNSFANDSIASIELKSKEYWQESGPGSNHSNFGGLPGGFRYRNGNFSSMGYYSYWWSSSQGNFEFNAWFRSLSYKEYKVGRYYYDKDFGFSVRCVKD